MVTTSSGENKMLMNSDELSTRLSNTIGKLQNQNVALHTLTSMFNEQNAVIMNVLAHFGLTVDLIIPEASTDGKVSACVYCPALYSNSFEFLPVGTDWKNIPDFVNEICDVIGQELTNSCKGLKFWVNPCSMIADKYTECTSLHINVSLAK